jgi:hypothetical protein
MLVLPAVYLLWQQQRMRRQMAGNENEIPQAR